MTVVALAVGKYLSTKAGLERHVYFPSLVPGPDGSAACTLPQDLWPLSLVGKASYLSWSLALREVLCPEHAGPAC